MLKHVTLQLDDDQAELPAISADEGPDDPAPTQVTGSIDSILTIEFTGMVSAVDDEELVAKLTELRADVHTALMADPYLGLDFVQWTHYGGTDQRESVNREKLIGLQRSRWRVQYRMNLADPN